MILFSIITILIFFWNLKLVNDVRNLSNSASGLKEEIEGAASSCGVSMN